MNSRPTTFLSLGVVILLAALLVIGLRAYLSAILAALVFAPLFRPVYLKILRRVKRRSIAAWATLVVILLLVVIPLGTIGILAFREVQSVTAQYRELTPDKFDMVILGKSIPELVREGAGRFLEWLQSRLLAIASGALRLIVGLFVMCYLIFYLLRDMEKLEELALELLPFGRKNSRKLLDDFHRISRGFVLGQGLTALLQGALGAIGFMFFDFPGALLWGMVMAVLCLIPVLGAFIVWVPAGILQIASGATGSGIGILVWGAVLVSTTDNFVRPLLMKNMAGVHPVVALLGVFAGISLFGFIGIIAGPLLFATVLETARMFYREQEDRS